MIDMKMVIGLAAVILMFISIGFHGYNVKSLKDSAAADTGTDKNDPKTYKRVNKEWPKLKNYSYISLGLNAVAVLFVIVSIFIK